MNRKNNCNCKKPSKFCTCNDFCDDSQDLDTSIELILESESSISECAAKLFSSIFPCELDSLDDIQKKINLFTQLLLAYNNRACSLGKLIHSVSEIEETYIPNPHIEVFDCKSETCAKPAPPSCNDAVINKIKESLASINCCVPPSQPKHCPPPTTCCEPPVYCPPVQTCCEPPICPPPQKTCAKPLCNGLYFLDKVRIYFSCNNLYVVYDIYFNSNNCNLAFSKAKNQCTYIHTYVVN